MDKLVYPECKTLSSPSELEPCVSTWINLKSIVEQVQDVYHVNTTYIKLKCVQNGTIQNLWRQATY